jgi:hypothetical protein
MKVVMLGLIGFVLGAIAGGVIGLGLGFIWTSVFHTSSFEGYSGMLVFFTFMPIGIFIGALGGAIGLGDDAARDCAIARRRKPLGPEMVSFTMRSMRAAARQNWR